MSLVYSHSDNCNKALIAHTLQSRHSSLHFWKTSASNFVYFQSTLSALRPFETRTKEPVCVLTTCRLSSCQSPLVQERCLSATLWIGLILSSHLLPGVTEAGISPLSLSGLPQLCVGVSTFTSWHLIITMTLQCQAAAHCHN